LIPHIIIGAGLAGLTAARALNAPIIEKSKGLGGRLATRRIGDEKFDHGLGAWPDTLEAQKLNSGSFIHDGMTTLPKEMAKDLAITRDCRINKIEMIPEGWRLHHKDGALEAKNVILTAPLPQALELLSASDLAVNSSWQIDYHKALIGIYQFPVKLTDKSLTFNDHQIIFQKDKNLCHNGVVLISSSSFADEYFEKSDTEILEQLNLVLFKAIGKRDLQHAEVKKWRYSTPKSCHEFPYLEPYPGLYLIGDAFLYPGVEGALLSAQTLVREKFRVL
jgi:renalase